MIKKGKYRHYKGLMYEVIGTGKHANTGEDLVFYKALYYSEKYGDNALWARPIKEFLEIIELENKKVPRFEKIEIELVK